MTIVGGLSAPPEPASPTSPPASPTAAPTEVTNTDLEAVTPAADPSTTPETTPNANWISYNNADYGFSFRYPEDSWALIERPQDPNLLSLAYHEQGIALRIRFKRLGEEGDLQLYGGAAGDFVERGTVHFLGEDVGRSVVVYEDIDRAVHYNGTRAITRDDLQFTLALVSNRDYESGAVVPEAVQAEADRILETFAMEASLAGSMPGGAPIVFLYRNGALARTDLEGSVIEPLVPATGMGDDRVELYLTYPMQLPQVSPDGRWLLDHVGTGQNTADWLLFDVATGERIATGSGQAVLSTTWAADSAAFAYLDGGAVCIHTIETGEANCLPAAENLVAAAWSPNGSTIALAQVDPAIECCRGAIWLLDVASGALEQVAEHNPPPQAAPAEMIEWLADGRLFIKHHLFSVPYILDPLHGDNVAFTEAVSAISPDGRYVLYRSGMVGRLPDGGHFILRGSDACPQPIVEGHNWAWSPDGARLAFVLSCAEAEYESRLAVHDLETGAIVWERAFTGTAETFQPPGRVFWSPDGEYLLLDGPDIATRGSRPPTPIRRLAADGSGEPEIIVDRGYLLGIVSQWREPWLRDR